MPMSDERFTISEERFDKAGRVVEAGAKAAKECGLHKLGHLETFAMLTDELRGINAPDALLDLLGVALMKLAVERAERAVERAECGAEHG